MRIGIVIGAAALALSCSSVEIVWPPPLDAQVGARQDLVVRYWGCSSRTGKPLRASLDGNDVSDAFQGTPRGWIAPHQSLAAGTHTLEVRADLFKPRFCFGSDTDSRTIHVAACPPGSYCAYFQQHPRIAALTVEVMDAVSRSYFWEYVSQLEREGIALVDPPDTLLECRSTSSCSSTLRVSPGELKRIRAAWMAHAVWLDKSQGVPWRLDDYTDRQLAGLFGEGRLRFTTQGNYHYFQDVVDHSPSEVYRYALDRNLVRGDRLATLRAVLDDLRPTEFESNTGFAHGLERYGDPQIVYTLVEALTTYSDRGYGYRPRIARTGCSSMSGIVLGLLRSVNIPGEWTSGEWYLTAHTGAVWPALGRVLPHGDEIYNALARAAPSDGFLPSFDFYTAPENTAVCGTDKICLSARHRALRALAYPSQYTIGHCCDAEGSGESSCEGSLAGLAPYLTEAELAAGVADLLGRCN